MELTFSGPHNEQHRLSDISSWPELESRLAKIAEMPDSEGEPFFFLVDDDETGKTLSPLYIGEQGRLPHPLQTLVAHLFDDMDIDQLLAILQSGDTVEIEKIADRLGDLKTIVHIQPERVIDPSWEDIEVANALFGLFHFVEQKPPTEMIGRRNLEGGLDFLLLDQVGPGPSQAVYQAHYDNIEKRILGTAISRVASECGYPDESEALLSLVEDTVDTDLETFVSGIHEAAQAQGISDEVMARFSRDHTADYTLYPEYVQCVADELSRMDSYSVSTVSVTF